MRSQSKKCFVTLRQSFLTMTTITRPTIANKLLQWQKHFVLFLFGGAGCLGFYFLGVLKFYFRVLIGEYSLCCDNYYVILFYFIII